ncbi:uncharacterized protein LOC123546613 [Mercenaria mercenaria]|uniref:uncharacterized protein LOC123546613 n=1 Tax=Mercenaria mercenaria TaxID=6596 RepID=UPI00234F9610|nr:uncharacterized protein LOC123546613 [Mercenaria mercenaria]
MAFKLEDIPIINLGQFLLRYMKQHDGNKVAMVDSTTEESFTYAEIIDRTEKAAAGLQKFGVKKDDVIAIVSPNCPDYLISFYASALISATFQPVNPLFTSDDLKKVFEQCNTKFVITIPELLPKVSAASENLSSTDALKVIVFGEAEAAGGHVTFQSLIDSSDGQYTTPSADPKKDVVAFMLSSGTTGFPKAVMISHYTIVANTLIMHTEPTIPKDDHLVMFLPLFHIYGLYLCGMYSHFVGAALVIMKKFSPDDYLRLIEKYKPSTIHTVPPIMVMFAKYPKVSEYDLSSVKVAICGAAPLSKEIEDVVKTKLKLPCINQGYGMTEIGVTHLNGKGTFKYKSVGKLLPLVEMKIVDVDTGKTCDAYEEGEIWIRGPQVCLGYLNAPEETKTFFTEDGWAKTGDIGCEDEDGYLFIVDRLKELIKYKGFQVAPASLEDVLLRHDAVADTGVVGLPDEDAGELPRAYVVRKAGKEVTEEELVEYVNGLVAPHMKLRGGVEFVTEIPRTPSGKILRKTLREKAKAYRGQKPAS